MRKQKRNSELAKFGCVDRGWIGVKGFKAEKDGRK